jgi:hypothetical protein
MIISGSPKLIWMESVPPRGSGWVRSQRRQNCLGIIHDFVPTRYREVVLTASKQRRGGTDSSQVRLK